MRKMVVILCAVAISCFLPETYAADELKITLSVTHSGKDRVGQNLAFALREVVRASSGYQLVSGPSALFRVTLKTIDPHYQTEDFKGLATVAAVTITMRNLHPLESGRPQTWYPIFIASGITMSGADRIDEFAKTILADIDSAIEDYRTEIHRKE